MQRLLSSHRPQATRKPCLNSHNRVHGRKLVSVEGGDCSKRSNFSVVYFSKGTLPTKKGGEKGHLAGGPRHLYLAIWFQTEYVCHPSFQDVSLFTAENHGRACQRWPMSMLSLARPAALFTTVCLARAQCGVCQTWTKT